MARTKASVGAKVSSFKSSKARCSAAPPSSSVTSSGSTSERGRSAGGGGNPVCPRETPKWQRPITNFFNGKESQDEDQQTAGSSKPRKRNVIESDEEGESSEKPVNQVLDETIELQPLSGEDSHKIDEYYDKNGESVVQNDKNHSENKEQRSNGENHVQNGENHVQNGENHVQNGEEQTNSIVKGKGIGKKTNKENIDENIERRKSVKRDFNEVIFNEESEHASKKVKVN